jgi:hypothetical protein
MLRGNHEDYNTSMIYGMLDECLHKYGNFIGQRVWLSIVNVYNHMPFAALVADKIFALHGGLSPHMKHPSDINRVSCYFKVTNRYFRFLAQQLFRYTDLLVISFGLIRTTLMKDGR